MLIELRRPYVDVSAGDLSLTLGLAAAPALEVLEVHAGGGMALELRLLGFSHQVLVDGGRELSETVACVPGVAGTLPQRRSDGAYRFGARVQRLAPADYAVLAGGLIERAGSDRLMLAGLFADAPAPADAPALPAFTALAARPLEGGVAWTTWHGYPQSGELVITASALEHGRC